MSAPSLHPVDVNRAAHGLPPIYCDPPRLLTGEELADLPACRRRIELPMGRALEPVVGNGQLFYREATA